jgi:hypothetical protein
VAPLAVEKVHHLIQRFPFLVQTIFFLNLKVVLINFNLTTRFFILFLQFNFNEMELKFLVKVKC